MKRIVKLIISFFVFVMFWGSCLDTASAKLANSNLVGKALCNPTSEVIQQAKESFNTYKVGQYVDLSPSSDLTNVIRVEKTIGKVHGQTVLKAGFSFDTYLYKLRGLNATAGKTFEESFRRSFNNMMTRQNGNYLIETTAALGKPHDSADLLVINKFTGKCELKIQQKLSAKAAVKAIINNKYDDCVLLIPSDQLNGIKSDLLNGTHKYIPKDSNKRKLIQQAIYKNRIASAIYGVQAKSMRYYQEATKRMYSRVFNHISDKIAGNLSRAIRSGEDIIGIGKHVYRIEEAIKIYRASGIINHEIEAAIRTAKFNKFKFIGQRALGYVAGVFDIGYGVYMIYDANSKYHKGLLDADLANYKKILGGVQIAVGVIEIVAESFPLVEPIVTPIVIVVSIAIVAIDMWIDHIQAQRMAARQRLIERVETKAHPDAIHQWLIRDMERQCAL